MKLELRWSSSCLASPHLGTDLAQDLKAKSGNYFTSVWFSVVETCRSELWVPLQRKPQLSS